MNFLKHFKYKRILASVLSATIIITSSSIAGIARTYPVVDAEVAASFSPEANAAIISQGFVPSGLQFMRTELSTDDFLGYWKFWVNDKEGKEVEMNLEGSGVPVKVNTKEFDNHYITCIADHKGLDTPAWFGPGVGTQMALVGVYAPTELVRDYPEFLTVKTNDINTLKFNLLFLSLLHSMSGTSHDGHIPDSDIEDEYGQTDYSMLAFAVTRRMEDAPFSGNDFEGEWKGMITNYGKLFNKVNPDANGKTDNYTNFVNQKGFCNAVYSLAKFLSYFNYSVVDGKIKTHFPDSALQASTDGKIHYVINFAGAQEPVPQFFSSLNATASVEGVQIIHSATTFEIVADSQAALGNLVLNNPGIYGGGSVKTAAPTILCGFKITYVPTINPDGTPVTGGYQAGRANVSGQERFSALQSPLEIDFIPGDFPVPEGKYQVTRYEHKETFRANYNINLHKYDSETGKPLSNALFDVLEAFNYGQISKELLSGDNWENSRNGLITQFDQWDGWDYSEYTGKYDNGGDDPCDIDADKTDDDGVLRNVNNGNIAHYDTKSYSYAKGHCGGHPIPDFVEVPEPEEDEDGNITNEDEIDAAKETNDELIRLYNAELDKCQGLAAEGGYFCVCGSAAHGTEDHDSKEGYVSSCNGGADPDPNGTKAQKLLEEDRDKLYEEFINLKYEYSAEEILAKQGYIIHGTHTDDIPIEIKTVTSSELKDLNGNKGGELPHGASQSQNGAPDREDGDDDDDDDDDEAEGESLIYPESTYASTYSVVPASVSANALTEIASTSNSEHSNALDSATNVVSEVSYNFGVQSSSEDETPVASASKADELEDGVIFSLNDDEYLVMSTPSNASQSDADDSGVLSSLFVQARTFFRNIGDSIASSVNGLISLMSDDDDDDDDEGGNGGGAGHPLRDSTQFVDSKANYIGEMDNSIVDHTFTVFDHRTEGELHFNKTDLNLKDKESDSYDSYGIGNGDGTLEGAEYGLFAVNDIVHPDEKTGVVYKAGELVSVATTDRNGDLSFMSFTEAPGYTYDYASGKIVKTPDGWADMAPGNLHKNEADGDAFSDDNETYIGHDSDNNEVTIDDSKAGDATGYNKHSSNQSGPEGIDGSFATYPISNNELNNGNCWIGRPLIVEKGGSEYVIRELSRSEGYELSISGKDNLITNGKESYLNVGTLPSVSIGALSYDTIKNGQYATITAENVNGDITIEGTSFVGEPTFAISSMQTVTETISIPHVTTSVVPTIPPADSMVIINNSTYEGRVGDTITINGNNYTVNAEKYIKPSDITVTPMNTTDRGTPNVTTVGAIDYDSFILEYNKKLSALGYGNIFTTSPWGRVELTGSTDTDWIACVTQYLADNKLTLFNKLRINEVVEDGGRYYAIIGYDYRSSGVASADNCLYDPDADVLYLRKDAGNGYDVFVKYPATNAAVSNIVRSDTNYITMASVKPQSTSCSVTYPNTLPTSFMLSDMVGKYYWVYDGVQQGYDNEGNLATETKTDTVYNDELVTHEIEVTTPLTVINNNGTYTITIPASAFDHSNTITLKIYGEEGKSFSAHAIGTLKYIPTNNNTDSYTVSKVLAYKSEYNVIEDDGTIATAQRIYERPIRQKVEVIKDIFTNADGETYTDDTYSAVHETAKDGTNDWLANTINGNTAGETAKDIPNFRFKAYLKSNLERLYRDNDGVVHFVDRNGNYMTPQYADTNGDGNYDTFTWKYDVGYNQKTVDFPEKDLYDGNILSSANVNKVYTEVDHKFNSTTTGSLANNSWERYNTPQGGSLNENGEKVGYTTSLDGTKTEAVVTNEGLYSYNGNNINVALSDKLNATQNIGYSRLLETIDNADGTHTYNYKKFFGAINAANADIWDDDMHSTYTGTAMSNYPGQEWFETFYEKYQKDDVDASHTLANTDGVDKDNTAGGDKDTSFKPFRWIREHLFGDRTDYEQYPAQHNGVNTENTINTSYFAHANAEASDAVRQFATDWYLEDEVAKLVKNNGQNEDIAIVSNGNIGYSEAIHDEALFNAIAKAYNYLKPFYQNDLDTIYSVEWDSAPNGGFDNDYTTLSADSEDADNSKYFGVSAYLPYGTYVINEVQPERVDINVNDFENRHYLTDEPKEIALPSLYDATTSNETFNNYDMHYAYNADMITSDQAKAENYLIRFNEEWAPNNTQDMREFVIRAHNNNGDYEIYKYGLDTDKLSSTITYNGGAYNYAGFSITQSIHDPLKDYYEEAHRGEAGLTEIGIENGGNNNSHFKAIDSTNQKTTPNGKKYEGKELEDRFFYGSISENRGVSEGIRTITGELTSRDGEYSSSLVPWSVLEPIGLDDYNSTDFIGNTDIRMTNTFMTSYLTIDKLDSETGEPIIHDDAIFALYAASRYNNFAEIMQDADTIADADEKALFIEQFKPGDTRFYMEDTMITGTKEFLEAMKATEITSASRAGAGNRYTGIVKKGTPICVESERIDLTDITSARTGDMTVHSTMNDLSVVSESDINAKTLSNQNVGYFRTSKPIGAGAYVLAEIDAPLGYVGTRPVAMEVYSDGVYYYPDGDMYSKVKAVRYGN